ncbi:LLM class flavin-dependent oxidoreductase [Bacillus altitudinis]|uniref:LLM class flavin-dependent oxidoreductase n=1 Tax=Bacillus altitudinis TaxID=293387 RepID=UPI003F7C254F
MTKEMKLAVYLVGSGMHLGSWRLPHVQADASIDVNFYRKMALKAEEGKLDAVFIADSLAIDENSHPHILNRFDPAVLITAMGAATNRIGVVATASTTYSEPYVLARQFASIDHATGGRAGWNVVTTADATGRTAQNFGRTSHVKHDDRYQMAEEFIDVVQGLWDSWEDDAFIRDKKTGQFYDEQKVHPIHHKGTYFQVRGPLNIGRTPQGQPVIFQAGSSEPGQQFAARTAEVVFSHKKDLQSAQAFYKELKERLPQFGRRPNELHILQGISPVIGRTKKEAQEKKRQLNEALLPEQALKFLSGYVGNVDLTAYSPDTPAKEVAWKKVDSIQSDFETIMRIIHEQNPTVGELYAKVSNAASHDRWIGTPEQIADEMEKWVDVGAADGFMLIPAVLPDTLKDFVELVVPILQERKLFRTDYKGHTLREHLGLRVPVNRYQSSKERSGL